MWPTIVTCQASNCSWNQYSTETKVSSCTKLMILLNESGVCTELAKYQINPELNQTFRGFRTREKEEKNGTNTL